jgi:hypothetical protein
LRKYRERIGGNLMKKKIFIIGMFVIILTLGMTVISCRGSKLNGTWLGEGDAEGVKIKYENGKFEVSWSIPYYNGPVQKGTYIIKGNEIIQTITHVHGGFLNLTSSKEFDISRWYTKEEAVSIDEDSGFRFNEFTFESSIAGNTLTMITKNDAGDSFIETYIRQQDRDRKSVV